MNDSAAAMEITAAPADLPAPTERRWPAIAAIITAWLFPATTARKTAHVRLLTAWGVHLLAALLVLVLIFFAGAWTIMLDRNGLAFDDAVKRLARVIWRDCRRYPEETAAVVAFTALSIEIGYAVLALLIVAWGARAEKMRDSYRHALRWVWLHSANAAPVAVVMAFVIVTLNAASRNWREANRFVPPAMPPNATPSQVQAATNATQRHWASYYERRPWYVKYDDEVMGYAGFACATWVLWALLRGAGVARATPSIDRPPTCEFCGYNLTTAPMGARCPECGVPVMESLGPGVRPGAVWERRRRVGFARAWWRCAVDAVVRPTWFGRQIRLGQVGDHHRSFLAMHLPLLFVVGVVAVLASYAADTGRLPFGRRPLPPDMLTSILPLAGYFTAATGLLFPILAAGVVAFGYQRSERRNLLGAAMQIAAYLSGYFVLWAVLSAAAALAFFLQRQHSLNGLADLLHWPADALAFFVWVFPTAMGAVAYMTLLSRGTAATRYANH